MQLNYAPTSYRLHAVDQLFAEISARPAGTRKTRMFDLEAELRDLRVEEVFNAETSEWRWVARLTEDHSVSRNGERIWERELRREGRLEEIRFPNRGAAQAALQKYLDDL
jgi:hypothetical protein